MIKFILSAFADEYSPDFDKQLLGLAKHGIDKIELRGINGKNVADLTPEEAKEIKKQLDSAGISLSAVGSPLGKISIDGDIDAHIELTRRLCETAGIMSCTRIRGFSFYGASEDPDDKRGAVIDAVGRMAEVCSGAGVLFCHENEKGIYGDTPERCLDLINALDGKIGCIFDPANYIQSGCEPYPGGFSILSDKITYMHIKDASADGTVVPAGCGIGCIPETLSMLAAREGEMILTLEPHLRVFHGLSELEHGERTKLQNAYATSEEAFAAAVAALRSVLNDIGA